jgi:hypothetical protein
MSVCPKTSFKRVRLCAKTTNSSAELFLLLWCWFPIYSLKARELMLRKMISPCRLLCTLLALANMSHAFVFDKPSFPSMPLFTAGLKSDFSLKLRGGGLFPSIFNSKISQKLKASMDGFSSVGKKTTGKGSKLAGKWTKVKEVGQEDAMLQVFLHRVRMFRIWLAGVVSARAYLR